MGAGFFLLVGVPSELLTETFHKFMHVGVNSSGSWET